MTDPLYRKEVLRLAADAHGAGHLTAPDATGSAHNPACGDKVSVELDIENGRIAALAHDTKACILAQASASILGRALEGKSRAQIRGLRGDIQAMLRGQSAPPAGFEEFSAFEGVREHTKRHACVLLPFDAVLNALEGLEPSEPGSVGTKT